VLCIIDHALLDCSVLYSVSANKSEAGTEFVLRGQHIYIYVTHIYICSIQLVFKIAPKMMVS